MSCYPRGDLAGERLAIDGEGGACRHTRFSRYLEQKRPELAHLGFQQPMRVCQLFGLE